MTWYYSCNLSRVTKYEARLFSYKTEIQLKLCHVDNVARSASRLSFDSSHCIAFDQYMLSFTWLMEEDLKTDFISERQCLFLSTTIHKILGDQLPKLESYVHLSPGLSHMPTFTTKERRLMTRIVS